MNRRTFFKLLMSSIGAVLLPDKLLDIKEQESIIENLSAFPELIPGETVQVIYRWDHNSGFEHLMIDGVSVDPKFISNYVTFGAAQLPHEQGTIIAPGPIKIE